MPRCMVAVCTDMRLEANLGCVSTLQTSQNIASGLAEQIVADHPEHENANFGNGLALGECYLGKKVL